MKFNHFPEVKFSGCMLVLSLEVDRPTKWFWWCGIWQVMSMIPGFSQELMPKGREKESSAKIKKFMTMMDSMTDEGPFSFPKTSFVIQLIQD